VCAGKRKFLQWHDMSENSSVFENVVSKNKERNAKTENAYTDRHYYFLLSLLFASVILICFCLLFFNYSTYVFLIILSCFFSCFVWFFPCCVLRVFVLFLLLYIAVCLLFFTCLLTTATGWKPNCSK